MLKKQDIYTNDLAAKMLVLDTHVKRAKKVGVKHIAPKHKAAIRKMMNSSRKIFNMATDLYNKGLRGEELRGKCVRSAQINDSLKKVSEHVRQKAFDKFSSSLNSCETNKGHLSFISRKKDSSWLCLQKRDCIFNGTELTILKKYKLTLKESFPTGVAGCDVEINESKGVFHVVVMNIRPYSHPYCPDLSKVRTCALDMGERTFGTLYDPDGSIAALGTDVQKKVKNKLRVIYKLRNGLKTKNTSKKKSSILKAISRASAKLKNMIKDMHHRIATWLVQNYDVIIIGKLGIGVMKCKRQGKRVLQSLSHYSFRRTLIQKASLFRKKVSVVSEAYTTKQCNCCGYMNWTIGSSETFSCRNCQTVCHRDVHSSRGIFIRSMRT
jgi:putative transposase